MITINVNKNNLIVRNKETITSGSSKIYYVSFAFNSAWDSLVKNAVFRAGTKSISVVLDDTDVCVIPWEVMSKAGLNLEVGVYGTKDESVVLPTVWGPLGLIKEGASPGENTQEPTPSAYEQLISQMETNRKAAEDAAAKSADRANAASEAAGRAETAAIRQPYPNQDTDTWWSWDATKGAYVDTGKQYTGSQGVSGLLPVIHISDSAITLPANACVVVDSTLNALNATLEAPVADTDTEYRLIFKAGADFALTDTAPGGYVIKWESDPIWTAGTVYEISYGNAFLTDANGQAIIGVLWRAWT